MPDKKIHNAVPLTLLVVVLVAMVFVVKKVGKTLSEKTKKD
jgi:F0F1-type ATP synthase membrane subunit b/b'